MRAQATLQAAAERGRARLIVVAAALLLCAPRPAHAALPEPATLDPQDLPDEAKRPRTVAVLPVKAIVARASELLAPQVPRDPVPGLKGLADRVVGVLAQQDYLTVLPPAEVRRRLARDRSLDAAARTALARYRLGLEYYMGLSPARAARSLRESATLYEDVFRDVSAPKSLADAWFMLGVSLVDAGDTVKGHVALKRGFAVQPDRRFRARFFAPRVERALHAALADHLSTGNHRRPYGDARRLARLARRLGVDALVTVAVVQSPSGEPQVLIATFRADQQRVDSDVALPLSATATGVEPALSRWVACLPVRSAPGQARRGGNPPVFMDTAAAYALYLRQPTRRPFHSVGFAAGVAAQLRPGLEWYARLHMFTSLSDPYRDLLHAFNSVRVLAGVGFALQRGPVRLWVRPGLDVHVLGRFIATTDPDCKLFGEGHPLCSAATIRNLEQDALVGFHLAFGMNIALGRRFFLLTRLAGSAYVLPLSDTDDLNFPVGAELGLGYRF